MKQFEEIDDDDWRRFFEVNVLSGVRLSRQYLPGMKQRNSGRIIFISSESGVQIPVEMIHYGMTKTAQIAVARGLAETTKGSNVTVNSVLAGPTSSEGVGNFVKSMAAAQRTDVATVERDFFKNVRPSSLIGRFARTEEVAALAASGTAERDAAVEMAERIEGEKRVTVGADKGYDTRGFVRDMRERNVTPHVSENTHRPGGSAIDGRTTRHAGYQSASANGNGSKKYSGG